ncbi:uncharacterized protein V6R79_017252 [Siganus canaliculatus]
MSLTPSEDTEIEDLVLPEVMMEKRKKESPQQLSRRALPREGHPHHRISVSEQGRHRPSQESHHGTVRRRSAPDKYNIATTKRTKEVSEETRKLDEEYARLMERLNQLEVTLQAETFLAESRKKFTEDHANLTALFGGEADKIEDGAIEKLQSDIETIRSEIATNEKILERLQRNKASVQKLVSLTMEVNRSSASKCNTNHQDVQSEESQHGLESSPGPVLPSTSDSTLIDDADEDMSDPQLLLLLMKQLSDQTLTLHSNFSITDDKLKELKQMFTTTTKEMNEEDEKFELEENDLKKKIDSERKKAAFFKMVAELHNSSKTADQDSMLDSLGNKVAAVHQVCVDNAMDHFSTLEKLAQIELRVFSLMDDIECIDKETLKKMRMIKDSERQNRLKEEMRQKRLQSRADRSLNESKKIGGRKLMPKFFPVEKIGVTDVDNTTLEQDFHAFLLTDK